MSRLVWDAIGTRTHEYGVDRAVFYPKGLPGEPWNGLIAVNEAPSGSVHKPVYFEGQKVNERLLREEYAAVVSAIDYPDVIEQYEGLFGKPLSARPFDFTYRSRVATDANPNAARKIHLVYDAIVTPVKQNLLTLSNQSQYSTFDWAMTTKPVHVDGAFPTSHLILDDTVVDKRLFPMIEDILYGDENGPARMPRPEELVDILDIDLLFINYRADGLSRLVLEERWDLQGKLRRGLYKRSKTSRLKETNKPGLYILE